MVEFEAEMTRFMELVRAAREKRLPFVLRRGISRGRDQGHKKIEGAQQSSTSVRCGAERQAEFYDRFHGETDSSGDHAWYFPLFRRVVENVCRHGSRSILEVGCGTGSLAKFLNGENRNRLSRV